MRAIDADLLVLTDMEIIMCDGDYKEALKMLIDKIEHVPTIEPERKTGKWLLHTYMPHNKYCSCCEKDSPYDKWWNFCPYCGADMRGEQDG